MELLEIVHKKTKEIHELKHKNRKLKIQLSSPYKFIPSSKIKIKTRGRDKATEMESHSYKYRNYSSRTHEGMYSGIDYRIRVSESVPKHWAFQQKKIKLTRKQVTLKEENGVK
mmetsp:Transcript_23607/g.20968  ORF Transcript_23607/g.20968 Transcript_23607/m.20968 type:complete len:113 (-) Transcript_23607:94-432(-)